MNTEKSLAPFEYDENVRSTETESKGLNMIDVFTMNEEEKDTLREKIKNNNGAVQFWIHSHYKGKSLPIEEAENFAKFVDKRQRMMETSIDDNKMPIFSFIEANPALNREGEKTDEEEIKRYQDAYEEHMKVTKGDIYVVRTFQNHSTPCMLYQEDLGVRDWRTRVENWDNFAKTIGELGVRTIVLRGRNYSDKKITTNEMIAEEELYLKEHPELKPDEDGNFTLPGECVGNALVNMELRGFTVKKSNITFPEQMPK